MIKYRTFIVELLCSCRHGALRPLCLVVHRLDDPSLPCAEQILDQRTTLAAFDLPDDRSALIDSLRHLDTVAEISSPDDGTIAIRFEQRACRLATLLEHLRRNNASLTEAHELFCEWWHDGVVGFDRDDESMTATVKAICNEP